MARLSTLFTLFAISSLLAAPAGSNETTVHDILRAYGLPGGLLPKSVKSFSLDSATSLLEVRLDKPCLAKYDGLAYFDKVVRGNLSFGELRGVVGFSQEELFLWFPVKEIIVSDPSSGVILIDIGLAHKQLSISIFEDPPECEPEGEGGFPGSVVTVQVERAAEGKQGSEVSIE